jgi:Rod binding domain-containing protein
MTIHPTRFDGPLNGSKISDAAKAPAAGAKSPGALSPLAPSDFRANLNAALDAEGSSEPQHRSGLRPLTPMDMIPGIKGPIKPHSSAGLDDRPGIPPAGPMMPLDERSDSVPHQRKGPQTQEDKVLATARKWVAQTFYGTLLKQMRNSPFKSEMFEGGRGGQAFAPMLDQHLADHMSRGSDNKLVHAIARKLMKGSNGAGAQTSVAPATTPDSVNPNQDVRIHVAPSLRA